MEDSAARAEQSCPLPIGIIVVAHGKYGSAVLRAAESIVGPQEDCVSISVEVAHMVDETVARLNDAAERLNRGEGVIVLTDMFGGTPTNLALSLLANYKAEVVTGVNLPMLLKVIERRGDATLMELAAMAAEAGKDGIVAAGHMLRHKKGGRDGKEDKAAN